MSTQYEDTASLTCGENGQTLDSEVLDYTPGKMLACSVNRQVKVTLHFNQQTKDYRGKVGSLEFQSKGPRELVTLKGRQR
jgi:hypothetical protein